MSVFGKVIGGGMPLAAFGGKRAVMEQLAPLGPVYQAGTLSGNPVATACGLATLREIRKPGFHEALAAKTKTLVDGLLAPAREAGVPMVGDSEGGMFGFFFADACRRTTRRDGHRQGALQRLLPRHAGRRRVFPRRRCTKRSFMSARIARPTSPPPHRSRAPRH